MNMKKLSFIIVFLLSISYINIAWALNQTYNNYLNNTIDEIIKYTQSTSFEFDFKESNNIIDASSYDFLIIESKVHDLNLCDIQNNYTNINNDFIIKNLVTFCVQNWENIKYFLDISYNRYPSSKIINVSESLLSWEKVKIIWLRIEEYYQLLKDYNIPIIEINIDEKKFSEYNKIISSYLTKNKYFTDSIKDYLKYSDKLKKINISLNYKEESLTGTLERRWWIPNHNDWDFNSYKLNLYKNWEKFKSINLLHNPEREYKIFISILLEKYFKNLISLKYNYVWLIINWKNYWLYMEEEWLTKEIFETKWYPDVTLYKERNEYIRSENLLSDSLDSIFFDKSIDNKIFSKDNYSELVPYINIAKWWIIDFITLFDTQNLTEYLSSKVLLNGFHQDDFHNTRILFDNVKWVYKFVSWDEYIWQKYEVYIDKYFNNIIDIILKNSFYLNKRNEFILNIVSNKENLENDVKLYNSKILPFFPIQVLDKNKQVISKNILHNYYILNIENYKNNFNYILLNKAMLWNYSVIKNQPPDKKYCSNSNINDVIIWEKVSLLNKYECYIWIIKINNEKLKIRWNINPKEIKKFIEKSQIKFETDMVPSFTYNWKSITYSKIENKKNDYLINLNWLNNEDLEKISSDEWLIIEYKAKDKIDFKWTFYNPYLQEQIKIISRIENSKLFENLDNISKFKEFENLYLSWNIYTFKEKTNVVNKNIVLPKWSIINIEAWTIIKLWKWVSIISYGEIISQWTKKKPIIFISKNKKDAFWTIWLTQEDSIANFKYTYFINGWYNLETIVNGIRYTWTVSIHYAKNINIDNCIFAYSQSDDGLNIKRSKFNVTNNIFTYNSWDWFDVDFWQNWSIIKWNKFLKNWNDWLDLSWSHILVENNLMKFNWDKWISVWENSTNTIINNNKITNNNKWIEIKDNSDVYIWNNKILNNKIWLNLYQKKIFFWPAKAKLYNNVINWDINKKININNWSNYININKLEYMEFLNNLNK